MLDLFDKNCGNCIGAFPGYNKIQELYGDKLQIILVGRQDKENQIRPLYAKYRKQEKLILPCAFDSTLFRRLDVNSSPFAIIIDTSGVVQYITTYIGENDAEERNIFANILAGKHPSLSRAYREHEEIPFIKLSWREPFLVNGNGGPDTAFLFRSLLSIYNPLLNVQRTIGNIDVYKGETKFEPLRATLIDLYRLAYLGRTGGFNAIDPLYGYFVNKTILEVKDTSLFYTDISNKNLYCYSLIVPPEKDSKAFRMRVMQHDLDNYFGYDVRIETRKFPYWKIVATDDAKIKLTTKGGASYVTAHKPGSILKIREIRNVSMAYIIYHILPSNSSNMPFIDETGIKGNIDMTLRYKTLFGDLNDDKRALHENGLDLVRGEREMKVLVISNPKPTADTNTGAQ
jgi:hypothetical protein